jgi:hypothetical protein
MQKILFLLFVLGLTGSQVCAQKYPPFEEIRKYTATQQPNKQDSSFSHLTNLLGPGIHYIYPLYQAIGWEQKFKKSAGEKGFYEMLAQFLSFLGDSKKALEYGIKSYDSLPSSAKEYAQQEIDGIKNLQSIDARTFITGTAQRSRVVMINEAHDKPLHRAFTYSLLEDLYKDGFRYFAMETFNNYSNHSLTDVNVLTGFFTNEPTGGELARKALALGYTLISYEDTAARVHSNSQRDSVQAANLNEVIKKDGTAKILVHAGYGHISEAVMGTEFVPMAAAFKRISGIDPLTINQTVFTEGSSFEYGRIFYDLLMKKIVIGEPVVLLQNKKPVVLIQQNGYDIWVVHPPSVYKSNRPTWLSLNGERKEVSISPPENNAFLIQAYYTNEYDKYINETAVPADQTYLRSEYGYFNLYLKPGEYKIVLRDVGYKVISVKDRTVD